MAVCWHENHRNDVEKISVILAFSLKRSDFQAALTLYVIDATFHRLATFIVPLLECTLLHGVDILS